MHGRYGLYRQLVVSVYFKTSILFLNQWRHAFFPYNIMLQVKKRSIYPSIISNIIMTMLVINSGTTKFKNTNKSKENKDFALTS
jgi:hypothetical protein